MQICPIQAGLQSQTQHLYMNPTCTSKVGRMVYLSHLLSGRVSSADIHHDGHSMSIHTDMSMGIIDQCMKTDAQL